MMFDLEILALEMSLMMLGYWGLHSPGRGSRRTSLLSLLSGALVLVSLACLWISWVLESSMPCVSWACLVPVAVSSGS